jgi:hypothetical protein
MPGVVIAIDEDTGAQTISTLPPYDKDGAGGRCSLAFDADTLDTPGTFQAEIEVNFADGRNMTWFDLIQFQVREQFA